MVQFYAGQTLTLPNMDCSIDIHRLHPDGRCETARLGVDQEEDVYPQAIVLAGVWFGAELSTPAPTPDKAEPWALVG